MHMMLENRLSFTHDINGGRDDMYNADDICKMMECLIDNIFVLFGEGLFHRVFRILIGTDCSENHYLQTLSLKPGFHKS